MQISLLRSESHLLKPNHTSCVTHLFLPPPPLPATSDRSDRQLRLQSTRVWSGLRLRWQRDADMV